MEKLCNSFSKYECDVVEGYEGVDCDYLGGGSCLCNDVFFEVNRY